MKNEIKKGRRLDMQANSLRFDVDFENALLFGQYVMVVTDEKVSGGGLVEGYDEHCVRINGKQHSRTRSSFVQMPPPDVYVDFAN